MEERIIIDTLSEVALSDGMSALDYLAGEPEEWRTTEANAILACLRQGWPLHKANIQCMARKLNE